VTLDRPGAYYGCDGKQVALMLPQCDRSLWAWFNSERQPVTTQLSSWTDSTCN